MKFRSLTVSSLIGSTALAVGCFGSGGGGGGGAVAAGASVGEITSGLPAHTRAAEYDFNAFHQPSNPVAGAAFLQMESAGGDLLVSDTPFSNIDRVDAQGNGSNEASFLNDARQLVTVNGTVYAALSSVEAPGAGDIYQRTGSVWTLMRDGQENEVVIAAGANNGLWVAEGTRGTGNSATVLFDDGVTGLRSVASIESSIPTAMIEFNGELWLGSADSGDDGGPLHLHHGTTAPAPWTEEVDLPVQQVGSGVRQEVSDMFVYTMVVDATANPPVTRDLLFFAVANRSVGTGQGLGGQVLVTDGQGLYEVVANFVGAAPNCIAWHDDTLYIGDSMGRLWWRNDQNGSISQERGLDMTSIHDLLVDGAGDLLIAGGDANGPVIVHRTVAATTPPQKLYYVDDVAPLLARDCAICHDGRNTAASAVFQLASPRDDAADHPVVLTKVDTATPAMSVLLLEAANDSSVGGHGGGELWAIGSQAYNTVLQWITDGAEYEAPTTPPPPPPPATTTFVDVHGFLNLDCSGCHSNGTGGYTANANFDQSYTSAVSKTNAGTPENSSLLRKAAGQARHGGGAIPGYQPGQTKYDLLLKWIKDGTQKQ